MCLASCEAAGAECTQALDAACAIEMVHCFSLIHDDLPSIDDDDLRRGRPTCHKMFGEALAILAGDGLFALAFETMASCGLAPVAVLARASGMNGLVAGETADVLAEGKDADPNLVRFIHERKTASLIAASCEIGALMGQASKAEVASLREYGEKVGVAFQIADDLLNETATPEQLGKSAGSDRERKKATYPAVFGLEESRALALDLVDEAVGRLSGLSGSTAFLRDLALYSVERPK